MLAESQVYVPQNSGQGDHIPRAEGNSCLVLAHHRDLILLGKIVLGVGMELGSGKNDMRKDLWGGELGVKLFMILYRGTREFPSVTLNIAMCGSDAKKCHSHLVTPSGASQRPKPVHR